MLQRPIAALLLSAALSLSVPAVTAVALAGTPVAALADNCHGHSDNGGCDIPEAPNPIGLPLAGGVVLGGYVWYMRRRGSRIQSDDSPEK